MPCGGGLVVYLCGGGAGRLSSWPLTLLTPFVAAVLVPGLEGAGDEETSRSISMGVGVAAGVGWSAILERRFRCSGGRFSGCCASSSYLDERRDEYACDLSAERRLLLLVRSRSLTRECGLAVTLSGDEGGVLPGCGVVRMGTSVGFDFLADLVKREGKTIEADVGTLSV